MSLLADLTPCTFDNMFIHDWTRWQRDSRWGINTRLCTACGLVQTR